MKTTIKHAFLLLAVATLSVACNKYDINQVFGNNTDAIEPLGAEVVGSGSAVAFLQAKFVGRQLASICEDLYGVDYSNASSAYVINSFDILNGLVNENGESIDKNSIDFKKYSLVFATAFMGGDPTRFDKKFRVLAEGKDVRLYISLEFPSGTAWHATPTTKYYALIFPKLPDVGKIPVVRQDILFHEDGSSEVIYKSWEDAGED